MEPIGQRKHGEMLQLTIEVPEAIVAWLDELKDQMGFQ